MDMYPCTDRVSSLSSLPDGVRATDISLPELSSIHKLPIRYWKQDVENDTFVAPNAMHTRTYASQYLQYKHGTVKTQ
jgi:hypothetical protein